MNDLRFRTYVTDDRDMIYSKDMHLAVYFNITNGWGQMRCTELVDENGKDVYEGDIIISADDDISEGYNVPDVVVYHDFAFKVHPVDKYKDKKYLKFTDMEDTYCHLLFANANCRVIGNIYQNPELLTKGPK